VIILKNKLINQLFLFLLKKSKLRQSPKSKSSFWSNELCGKAKSQDERFQDKIVAAAPIRLPLMERKGMTSTKFI
jgi:hypothetical protein